MSIFQITLLHNINADVISHILSISSLINLKIILINNQFQHFTV